MTSSNSNNFRSLLGPLLAFTTIIVSNSVHAQPMPTVTTRLEFTCSKKLTDPNEPGKVPGSPFSIGDQFWVGSCNNLNEVLKTYCRGLDKQATQSETGQRCDPKSCAELVGRLIIPTGRTPKNCSIDADSSWCNCTELPKLPVPTSGSSSKVEVVIDSTNSVELSIDDMVDIFAESL